MSSRRWLEQLIPTDRKAVELIMYGETVAAGKLVSPVANTENEGEQLQSFGLPERILAGETLLQSLELVPKTTQNGQLKPRSGVLLLRSPTASTITIVFNGNSRFFTLPPSAVTVADTHILLVRDPNRCFGFFGIPELGEDYQACLDNLHAIIAALDAEEVYCVGLSAGGSTAIRVGCDLMARGILGFSVPTTLNLEDDKGAELKHYPQLTRLYKNARHMGIDLVKYYAEKFPRPSLILTYSASHVRDSWLALRMDNVPGAELVDTEGFTGHSTYVWLRDNDKLDPLFEHLFSLTPYGETADRGGDTAHAHTHQPRLLEGASL